MAKRRPLGVEYIDRKLAAVARERKKLEKEVASLSKAVAKLKAEKLPWLSKKKGAKRKTPKRAGKVSANGGAGGHTPPSSVTEHGVQQP